MENQKPEENFQEAREAWACKNLTEQGRSQAESPGKEKPGDIAVPAGGGFDHYRIVLRPKDDFETFRYQDVGKPGHIQRLAGKHRSGYWDDQAWLISKQDAHMDGDTLVADTREAMQVLETFSPLVHVGGNIFNGHPREDITARQNMTPEQKTKLENVRKAQETYHR